MFSDINQSAIQFKWFNLTALLNYQVLAIVLQPLFYGMETNTEKVANSDPRLAVSNHQPNNYLGVCGVQSMHPGH